MEVLEKHEKVIIDDYFDYILFACVILDCRENGDKLIVYKDENNIFNPINFKTLSEYKEDNSNKEVLYISEYIKKGSLKEGELDKTIDKIIEDMKEKANIYVEKFELEPMYLFPFSIHKTPIVISIVLAVIMLYITYPFLKKDYTYGLILKVIS